MSDNYSRRVTSSTKPNKRGARSRELVLDAAERVMAEEGYEAATLNRIVEESQIPISSVYHYFGSKHGVLLAVMERGAGRYLERVPDPDELIGDPLTHLTLGVEAVAAALEQESDFLRLVVTMAAQPPAGEQARAQEVVERVREEARARLRKQFAIVFGLRANSRAAKELAHFALAVIDGAFVAWQADPRVRLGNVLRHLPVALIALHEQLSA
jgi:AcrR family transcriptional regulator